MQKNLPKYTPDVGADGHGVGGGVPARGALRAVRRPPHAALVRQPARRRVPPDAVPRRRVRPARPTSSSTSTRPRRRRLRRRGRGPPTSSGRRWTTPACPGAVKTSGAKGVHVFVPLDGRAPAADAAAATRALAARAERLDPGVRDDGVHPRGPGRQGVPRLDPRGRRDVVAAYSPRIRPGMPVSFPVAVGRPRRRRPRRLHRPHRRGPPGRPGPLGRAHAAAADACPRTWSRRATPSRWRGCRPCTRASAAPAPAGRGERASQGSRTTGGSRCPSFSRPSPKWRPGSPPG